MIRFRTLGSVELHSTDGEPLDAVISQPKRFALLAYLALARPFGFHRRDRLFAMFWPEQDESRARDSLNQAIRFLRQSLGSSVVVSRGAEDVGLDRAQLWCDAVAFQAAVDDGQPREAIELYRGELLDGFFVADSHGFEEWLEAERGRLREQASNAARAVAEIEEAAGNLTQALRLGRLELSLSNGDERALRRWLMMLARAGDRAGAIQAYEDFARRLRDEYEAEPSPETQDLAEAIRREVRKPLAAARPPIVAIPSPQAAQPLESTQAASTGVFTRGWYVVAREIGAGGMATVYLAHDVRHSRWVAMKVLRPEIVLTVGSDGFLREIRIAAALQHPHIVPVFDSGSIDGRLYSVMPFVEGESLRARLEREGPLPLGEALRIAREVANGLAYAHKQGIVHRDIKPENILLTGEPGAPDSHAMIADFGIARAIATSGAEERLTQTGVVVGSPTYMSPEQAAGDALDGRSDVYSLGCVLYEMLAGKPPFVGTTRYAVLAKHWEAPVPNLDDVRPEIPRAVKRMVERALAKSPTDRYANAAELARAIQQPTDESAVQNVDVTTSATHAVTVGTAHRSRFILLIGCALLVAALATVGWFASGSAPASNSGNTAPRQFPKQDLAVLYFEDRSPDQSLRYLAHGITDALIDQVRRVPGLRVASRNGVGPSRHRSALAIDSVARALQVGTVIRGSVVPLGTGLLLKIEMIDGSTGHRLAATQVAQSERNSIWLQDSLAEATTRLLRSRLGDWVPNLVSTAGTKSPIAWDARQKANEAVLEVEREWRNGNNVRAALERLAEADSILATAEANDEFWTDPIVERARLAFRRANLYPNSDVRFAREVNVGLAHVERALRYEPNDADALKVRGTLRFFQWVSNPALNSAASAALLSSAEQDLVAAVASPPQSASAWSVLSLLRLNTRNLAGATLAAENALRLDPFLPDAETTVERLYLASLDQGLHDEVEKWCQIGHTRFPRSHRFDDCRLLLAALPSPVTPRPADVWSSYDEYVKRSAPNAREFNKLKGRLIVALALVQSGLRDSAIALANTSRGDSLVDPEHYLLTMSMSVYSRAGAMDSALAVLGRVLALFPQRSWLASGDKSWWFKELRLDPRYRALINQRR